MVLGKCAVRDSDADTKLPIEKNQVPNSDSAKPIIVDLLLEFKFSTIDGANNSVMPEIPNAAPIKVFLSGTTRFQIH